MRIQVWGCSGGFGAQERTTCFQVNDDTLIDAGTGLYAIPLDVQMQLKHVYLTHAHFDHIVALPGLADVVARAILGGQREPLHVYGLPETLQAVRDHLFNGVVWPKLTGLVPILVFHEVQVGDVLPVGDGQIEVVAATHNIPACGYLLQRQGKGWLFTGDTWRNPALWRMLNTRQGSLQLSTIVADAAFHNDAHDFAELCGHLTIADLADDIQVLEQQYVNLFVTHRKPADLEQLPQEMLKLQETMACKGGRAHILHSGHIFNL